MPALVLHYHPLSPFSRKAAVALAMHSEMRSELRVVDVFSGGLASTAFRTISPYAKMPVLETPEGPIIESTSIIEYLEERGERRLLPEGEERVARHFDRLGDLYLVSSVATLFWRPKSAEAQKAPDTARCTWQLFERQLDGRPFVAGAHFSLGDLSAAIATDYFEREGVEPPSRIRAWKDRCMQEREMAESLAAAIPFVESTRAMRADRA